MDALKNFFAKTFVAAVAILFAVGANYLYAAWTGPGSNTPPAGNTATPINVSSTDQIKNGGALGVAALSWGASSVTNGLSADQGGAIELGGQNSVKNPVSNGVPYIDLHFGTTSAQDYNFRIINSANNQLSFSNSAGKTFAMTATGGLQFPDNTTQTTAAIGGSFSQIQTFGASGTWSKPAGVTKVFVQLVGGGGAGGGGCGGRPGGSGGGGGGYAAALVDVSAVNSVAVTVGGGGAYVANGVSGSGNTTSFGSYASATGGAGGNCDGGWTAGGSGGSGTIGNVLLDGNSGDTGGLSGSEDNGPGGAGGGSYFGGGGAGGRGGTGENGTKGGGGGGMAGGGAGGNGGAGYVVIYDYK